MEQAIEDLLNQIANLYNADYQVPFYKEDNQMFGFDKQDYDIHQSNYDQIEEIAGEPYSVSWKSVRIGETDEVNARKKNGEAIPNIIFKDGQENEITEVVPIGDNFKQVTVQGQSSHGAVQEIFAIQTEEETANHDHNEDGTADDSHIHIAGKLNVVTYRPQTLQVTIVPVGGVSIPADLAAQLTEIYMQAGVAVDVATVAGFSPTQTIANPFPNIPSDWYSAYNDDMNVIINEFKDEENVDEETYYIFVLPVAHENTGTRGFMPKKRQFGFIFNQGLSGDLLVKTIAHELGHGAYHLEHTFETYAENPQLNGAPSANLMDYGTGTLLRKYQWDLIHDPASNFTLFDSDEEAAYADIRFLQYACLLPANIQGENYFVDLDNNIIKLSLTEAINGATYRPASFVGIEDTNNNLKGAVASIIKEKDGVIEFYFPRPSGSQNSEYYLQGADGYLDLTNAISFSDVLAPEATVSPTDAKKVFISSHNDNCGFEIAPSTAQTYITLTSLECQDCFESNDEETGEDTNICRDIELGPNAENNADQETIDLVANKLKGMISYRNSLNINVPPSGSPLHLGATTGSEILLEEKDQKVLEDKLFLLKSEADVGFYVIFTELGYALTETGRQDLADKALAKAQSEMDLGGQKIVLITVPYDGVLIGFDITTCTFPGLVETVPIVENNAYQSADNLFDYVLKAFQYIEKPLYSVIHVMLSDGSISHIEASANEAVSGYSFINQLKLYKSVYLEQARQKLSERPQPPNHAEEMASYFNELEQWSNEYKDLLKTAALEEINALNGNGFEQVFQEESGNILFREPYIPNANLRKEYTLWHYENNNSYVYAAIVEAWGGYGFNDAIHCYEEIELHEVVYGTIDALALALAPTGFDFVPDIVGAVYAVIFDSDNTLKIIEYSAAIVIPAYIELAFSAGIVQYKVLRSVDENNVISYRLAEVNSLHDDRIEKWVFSVRASNFSEARTALDEAIPLLDGAFENFVNTGLNHFTNLGLSVSNLNLIAHDIFEIVPILRTHPQLMNPKFAELVVQVGENRRELLLRMAEWDEVKLGDFAGDLANHSDLVDKFAGNLDNLDEWNFVQSTGKTFTSINPSSTASDFLELIKVYRNAYETNLRYLFEKLNSSKVYEVFEQIDNISPVNLKNIFFNNRGFTIDGRISPTTAWLKDNYGHVEMDKDITRVWGIIHHTGHPAKALDFNILKNNKGVNNISQVKELKRNLRLQRADEIEGDFPNVASMLRASTNSTAYRSRFFDNITALFQNPQMRDDFINLYSNYAPNYPYSNLQALDVNSSTFRQDLQQIFRGSPASDPDAWNAHHVIPANFLYNNDVVKDILEWGADNIDNFDDVFNFNSIDNFIFVQNRNHTLNGSFGHPGYDTILSNEINDIDTSNMQEAFESLIEIIDDTKSSISNNIFNTNTTINEISF